MVAYATLAHSVSCFTRTGINEHQVSNVTTDKVPGSRLPKAPKIEPEICTLGIRPLVDLYWSRSLFAWNPDRPDRSQVQNQFIIINPYPDDVERGELGDIQRQDNRLFNVRNPSAAHLNGVGIKYIHSTVTYICRKGPHKKVLVLHVEVSDNSFFAWAVTKALWIERSEFERSPNNVIICREVTGDEIEYQADKMKPRLP
jgi:hypothetical protein